MRNGTGSSRDNKQTEKEEGSQEEEVETNEGKLLISIQLEQLEGEDMGVVYVEVILYKTGESKIWKISVRSILANFRFQATTSFFLSSFVLSWAIQACLCIC